jgi:hypothetical protein
MRCSKTGHRSACVIDMGVLAMPRLSKLLLVQCQCGMVLWMWERWGSLVTYLTAFLL